MTKICDANSLLKATLALSYILFNVANQNEAKDQCSGSRSQTGINHVGFESILTSDEQLPCDKCPRVAVLEYNRVDLEDCQQSAEVNLNFFEKVAKKAADNGAKLILFPEDGLFIGTRSYTDPCLEDVPDPKSFNDARNNKHHANNPCLEPDLFASNPILVRLSCIARDYSLYVVANYGTRQDCETNTTVGETVCSGAGFLRLNTDFVFDPTGKFIARYRKYNPFVEIFQKAPELEHAYFDTPFGRFGIITCFDMLFKRPAIDLVEKLEIDTIVFPTLWYDELPILSSIQFQDAWSAGNEVNLLAANILRPSKGTTGSGIYAGGNAHYTHNAPGGQSRLLLANIAAKSTEKIEKTCKNGFAPLTLVLDDEKPQTGPYFYTNITLHEDDAIDTFNVDDSFVGSRRVCAGRVCCQLEYKIERALYGEDPTRRLALIARDSKRKIVFKWAEQACILATVLEVHQYSPRKDKTVSYLTEAAFEFKQLTLEAEFSTQYVYSYGAHDVSRLLDRSHHQLDCRPTSLGPKSNDTNCELIFKGPVSPIYSFGMYARPYDEDLSPDWVMAEKILQESPTRL